jgi:hypothetical protein
MIRNKILHRMELGAEEEGGIKELGILLLCDGVRR